MSDFETRILQLLAGRTLYSWGGALGLAKASIAHLSGGGGPSSKTLRHICAVERCSATWLTTGSGRPFEVNTTTEASETYQAVKELLGGCSCVLLVHDGERVALTLGTPIDKDGKQYTEWAVITGPVGTDLLELLRTVPHVRVAHVPPTTMTELVSGQMGNWQLIGDVGGPRGARNPDAVLELAKSASNSLHFRTLTERAFKVESTVEDPAMGLAQSDWIERIRTLSPEVQQALKLIVERL